MSYQPKIEDVLLGTEVFDKLTKKVVDVIVYGGTQGDVYVNRNPTDQLQLRLVWKPDQEWRHVHLTLEKFYKGVPKIKGDALSSLAQWLYPPQINSEFTEEELKRFVLIRSYPLDPNQFYIFAWTKDRHDLSTDLEGLEDFNDFLFQLEALQTDGYVNDQVEFTNRHGHCIKTDVIETFDPALNREYKHQQGEIWTYSSQLAMKQELGIFGLPITPTTPTTHPSRS